MLIKQIIIFILTFLFEFHQIFQVMFHFDFYDIQDCLRKLEYCDEVLYFL